MQMPSSGVPLTCVSTRQQVSTSTLLQPLPPEVASARNALSKIQPLRTNDLAKRLNVSLRQLQWWDERGIVSPAHLDHHRVYFPLDSFLCALVAELRDMRYPTAWRKSVIQRVAEYVNRRKMLPPRLVVAGEGIVHVIGTQEIEKVSDINRAERGGVWVILTERLVRRLL